ncbi:hypothetical protein ACHWQZ_G009976 [Mnemiopsis leidyi]
MALTLIDLLELPPHARTESNIYLNIPSLKRKCDLFYYLADAEAYQLLKYSELFSSSEDIPIIAADTNLCILFQGKVSLCHKTQAIVTLTDANESDKEDSDEANETKKGDEKSDAKKYETKESITAIQRGLAVVQMVTALLERRNSQKEEERALSLAEKRKESIAKGRPIEVEQKEIISRVTLFGRPMIHYSEGAYFGGPDMPHKNENNNQTDRYTFVSDTPCLLLVIPATLQSTIVNYHYLNLIRDKESLLSDHHITRRLTMPQKSALLHEMLEEHFIHENVLTKMGEPADVVYLIKSGYVRIYLDVKIPRLKLPEAVQHLPSTKIRQRNKTERLPVTDIGPGEFVGGFELMSGSKNYVFTTVATGETVAYNIRAAQFKDLIMRANTKSLDMFTAVMKTRWRLRRSLADFSLCPNTEKLLCELLGEDKSSSNTEEAQAELEALRSSLPNNRRSVPPYMMGNPESSTTERRSMRPPNRGPFADRVKNRMIELGFSSRRGI